MHRVLLAAVESTETVTHLPIPPALVGVLAFLALAGLLGATYAFKSVGTRH